MTVPLNLERAQLIEYDDRFAARKTGGKVVDIQFNPESLKLAFANTVQAPDQRGGSTGQFVGAGTTKLTLSLLFDVTAPPHERRTDVRELTREVVYFITPVPPTGANAPPQQTGASGASTETVPKPPPVGFQWGTFLFVGTVDQLDETLEFWSEDGRPLRAGLSLGLTKQSIAGTLQSARGQAGAGALPGTSPLTPATSGATMQGLAEAAGRAADWPKIAAANGIENPRRLVPGQLLDLARR